VWYVYIFACLLVQFEKSCGWVVFLKREKGGRRRKEVALVVDLT
jgi:hypothetical protein